MKLSIVLPCYNVQKYLADTINTLKKQTESLDCEIIVVDDGSKDNTFQLAKHLLDGVPNSYVIAKSNGGVSSARNFGLAHSTGNYVYFLDGDDLVDSTLFEKLKKIKSDPDIIYWNYKYEYDSGKYKMMQMSGSTDVLLDYLLFKSPLHIGSLIFKRQLLLDNALIFNEKTAYGEDREFIIKGLTYSKTSCFINNYLFIYKWRENSAMHVKRKYTLKDFSGVESSLRIADFFLNLKLDKYAVIYYNNVCVELLVHKRQLLEEPSNEYNHVIDELLDKYLKLSHISLLNKYYIFVSFAKILYYYNKKSLLFLLKHLL